MKLSGQLLLIFSLLYCGTGCKKSSADGSNNNEVSIVNKWFYVNRITWTTPNGGTTSKDKAGYPPGSYADFRSDGKAYSYIPDGSGPYEYDTAGYKISKDTLILFRKSGFIDTLTIKNLTSNVLTTYLKDTYSGGTEEVWTNCRR